MGTVLCFQTQHSEFPNGMPDFANPLPPDFFVNLGCPLVQVAAKAIATEAPPSKTTKEPLEVDVVEDQSRL